MAQQDYAEPGATDWFDTQGPPAAPPPAVPQTGGAPTGPFTPQTAGTPTGAAPSRVDPYAIIRQTIAGQPASPALIDPILAALRAQGINATRATHGTRAHPQASNDAIVMPDGTYVDLIRGWDGPKPKWNSISGPSGSYNPTRNVIGPDGQLVKLADYQQSLGLPVSTYVPAGPKGGLTPLSGVGGATAALMTAPGFQFRISEGQKALERSAAARGTLLTGGTLKAITRYGQDFASNEYNNRYNQLMGLANIGFGGANAQANQNSSYAANTGNILTNQANTGTGLITGGANAQASGTVGAANARAQALLGGADAATQAALLAILTRGGTGGPVTTPPYNPNATLPPTGGPSATATYPGSPGWMDPWTRYPTQG